MKIFPAGFFAAFIFSAAINMACAQEPDAAQKLADAVVAASGGEAWAKIKTIDFTFNVEGNGRLAFSAKHHWDRVAETDAVSWGGKTAVADLKTMTGEGDAKEAYKRWVNDAYWLLAPLKLRDPGTHLADKGEQRVDEKTLHVLELSFGKVGLTSGDKYNFYIDPETRLVARWDYMPAPGKKTSGTWENYQDFGGVKLATEHRFGDKRIFFTDISVTRP